MARLSEQSRLKLHLAAKKRREELLTMPREVVIPGDMTFTQWCEELGRAGMKVDGMPFTLDNRPAMRFLYDLIPSDIDKAHGQILVLQKCAQVGFTVMEMLACIYFALKWAPCKVGMYLPDMKLAGIKSSERFMPIVRTVPLAYGKLTDGKAGEGNVLVRNMGDSRFHFLWTSGKAMTESIPLDVLSFDEVQEMMVEDMEKTRERLSASRIRFLLMGSTANWPDADINWFFKRGTQYRFHTLCPCCGESSVLDEYFPECIAYNASQVPGAPLDEYVYVCRHCGGWIDDPQRGEWIAEAPGAKIISAHFPQFLSPMISAREIIDAYHNAKDMKNFYNRKLGKPYVDPSQVPVNLEILGECERLGIKAGLVWKKSSRESFMGVDNMGGFSCVYLAERMPDGRMATIHVEAIYGLNPWARLDELMEEYRVAVCVCEQLPNYDSAKGFASRFPGRVFLVSSYGNIEDDMLRWGDANLSKADRKTADEYRDRYTLSVDQYKLMSWAMGRITKHMTLFPDAGALVQDIDEKGFVQRMPILSRVVWTHFTKTALVTEIDEEEHKMKRRVVKIGIDPHFSFAYMLCCAAWCRAYGTTSFMLPEAAPVSEIRSVVEKSLPGLPSNVLRLVDEPPAGYVCGRCSAFKDGHCTERGFSVAAQDAGCHVFVPQ